MSPSLLQTVVNEADQFGLTEIELYENLKELQIGETWLTSEGETVRRTDINQFKIDGEPAEFTLMQVFYILR